MARSQSAALDRKKLMADPIMVTTIVVLITFLTLFILYPLAILLVDSFVGDGTFGVSIFQRIFAMPTFTRAITNTLKVGFLVGILSALIAGAVTLIGVLIANSRSQAVTDTKLEELTREVREHNNFARRVPILEEQMKVANHRIADLENHERMKERN